MLSIPVQAQRQNTLALGEFGRWMVKQIDRWFSFAQRLGLGIVQMEEIVFVTGFDCARSWTNVVFLEGEGDARVSFGVDLVGGYGPDASIKWHFSPERIRGALLNQGPEGKVCRPQDLEPTNDPAFACYSLIPAEPIRESMYICPRVSCHSNPQDLTKAAKGGGGRSFRSRRE